MKSAPSIAFDVHPSRKLRGACGVLMLLAAGAPWASAMPLALRLLVSAVVVAWGVTALGRMRDAPFRRIAFRDGEWTLVDRHGNEHAAALLSHRHLGRLLTLDFRLPDRTRFNPYFLPDNLDAETFRRLIVLLARAESHDA